MLFHHMYVNNKSNFVDILHAENWKKLREKTCQKWKITQFWKSSKIINSAPNHVLNSRKNSYRVFDLKSKKSWKFIKPFFKNHKYRCQGALLTWFQKSEKMDFTWYLFKERSYDLINVWEKNLWSFRIFTSNIFLFEQKLTKIFTTRIVSFFFRPHSSMLCFER